MGIDLLPSKILRNYEIHEWKHACAILRNDFPYEWADIIALLSDFKICKSWINIGGGRKSTVSESIDRFLYSRGWVEKSFRTSIKVDDSILNSPTHKVDCYKNQVALEIEWNN